MLKAIYQASAISLCSIVLVACGGGGGGGGSSDAGPSTLRTGSFVDSPVEGLRYKTDSRSGLTNELGEFQYLEGEQVTFSIGGISLGVAEGQEQVTPFTLLGIKPLDKERLITATLNASTVSSFERALNIASLLQSLDTDGDPENGINLGNADQVLVNQDIDLFVKSSAFLGQTALSDIKTQLGLGNNRSLLDSVKHLYDSLEIEIESNQVAQFDSVIDSQTTQSTQYDYNPEGQVIRERSDQNGDGQDDVVKDYSYDARGNLTSVSNASQGVSETLTYDANDNISTRLTTTASSSNLERYFYNPDNTLQRFELDKGNDGNVDSITYYSYIGGELSSYTIDNNVDGFIEARADYVYDNGLLATFVEDQNNDGIPELIIAYSYDENGNRQSHNITVDAEGIPSAPGKFTYDQYGNVVRYELDVDLDEQSDYTETYTYNQASQRTSYFRDSDGDGSWNTIIQYTYNEEGRRTLMAEDNNGDGIADKVWKGGYAPQINTNAWDQILAEN